MDSRLEDIVKHCKLPPPLDVYLLNACEAIDKEVRMLAHLNLDAELPDTAALVGRVVLEASSERLILSGHRHKNYVGAIEMRWGEHMPYRRQCPMEFGYRKCRGSFIPHRSNQIYCQPACRTAATLERRRRTNYYGRRTLERKREVNTRAKRLKKLGITARTARRQSARRPDDRLVQHRRNAAAT